MQNHYNLIYREEEREMFPTLKVWLWCFFCGDNQYISSFILGSTWASVRFRGLLLLVVLWLAPSVLLVFAHRMITGTKATVRTKERLKLSMRKPVIHSSHERERLICWKKTRVERIAKARGISMAQVSLAWVMSQEGNYFLVLRFSWLNDTSRCNGTHRWNNLSCKSIWSSWYDFF